MTRSISVLLFLLVMSLSTLSQEVQRDRLKVFVDCSSMWCDMTYVRTEINIVDFLLDRIAADVHVLITNQRTGSGGLNYQIIFYGQNRFKNFRDSLRFDTDPNATDFERREKMVNYIKFGLAPLIAKTKQAEKMSVVMKTDSESKPDSARQEEKDKWNYWVFRVNANGNISSDQVYKSNRLSGGLSAVRTTDKIRLSFRLNGGQNTSKYEYESDSGPVNIKVKNSDFNFDHMLVKSIDDHWSLGYNFNYSSSTFSNNRNRSYFSGAIEYNIFPYKEVNNKLFTISYGIDVRRNAYYDTTIFNKLDEVLYGHSLLASLSLNQKWGYVNTGIAYHNYFHDWKFNNIGMQIDVDVRITGGLSFWTYMYGGIVHDQVYLPAEGASEDEVLTRRRQLASSYNIQIYFGLTYRFGSKLNNFVNPRFTGTANYLGY